MPGRVPHRHRRYHWDQRLQISQIQPSSYFLQWCVNHTLVMVLCRCIDLFSSCYFPMFSLFLTNDQDKVVMKVSYNQSRQTRCNTHYFTTTFNHSLIVFLLDYTKTVSNSIPSVKNGWEPIFGSISPLSLFIFFHFLFILCCIYLFWDDWGLPPH